MAEESDDRDPFTVAQTIAASMSAALAESWTRCPWCGHDYEWGWDREAGERRAVAFVLGDPAGEG